MKHPLVIASFLALALVCVYRYYVPVPTESIGCYSSDGTKIKTITYQGRSSLRYGVVETRNTTFVIPADVECRYE